MIGTKGKWAIAAAIATTVSSPSLADKRPREVWSVTRSSDPLTGDQRCLVTAFDTAAGLKFTRVGFLYPLVENSSKFGLLVGVSSGGRLRVPTGDIVWRIDDLPYRELKAADNPVVANASYGAPVATGNEMADRAVRDAMRQTAQLTAAVTATTTVASGDKAREMLAEMSTGKSLIFRQAQAAPEVGLPSLRSAEVGQFTNRGQEPYRIDTSFIRGLGECGIDIPAR